MSTGSVGLIFMVKSTEFSKKFQFFSTAMDAAVSKVPYLARISDREYAEIVPVNGTLSNVKRSQSWILKKK